MTYSLFRIKKLNIRRWIATVLLFCQFAQVAIAATVPNGVRQTTAPNSQVNLLNDPFLLSPNALNNFTISNQMLGFAAPLNVGVNYSNLTGTYFNSQYVTALGERAAFGAIGEYGSGQYRLNGTLGYRLAPASQIKVSIERFGQRLPFQFDSGDIDARIHQDAYGARFQQLFDVPMLQGVNAGGYWAKADNKQLNPIVFTSNGANCNGFAAGLQCINYRHIAGATSKGLDAGLDLFPTTLTSVSGNLYYDEVRYNTQFSSASTQNRSGLGAGIRINQLLNERFILNGEATTREIYDSYQAGISWLPEIKKVGIELSLSGQHIVSHNATPDNSIISVQLNVLPHSGKLYQRYNTKAHHLNELAQWIATPAVRMTQVLAVAEQITGLLAPSISSVSPNSGPISGGNTITINGANFSSGLLVFIGNQLATGINVLSTTQVTLVVPAISNSGDEQLVDVIIQSPDGQRVLLADGYTYINDLSPSINTVTPAQGSVTGNTLVQISGINLGTTNSVSFDGALATINSVSDNLVTVTTAAHAAGLVSVTLTTNEGTTTKLNAYTYIIPAPTITSIVANGVTVPSGGVTNNTTPTINGTVEQGTTVTIYDNGTQLGTAPVLNGAWSYTVSPPLNQGSHAFTALVTEGGSDSALSPAYTISVDLTPPPPPTIFPTDGTIINGLSEPGTTVNVITVLAVGTTSVNNDGTWSFTPPSPLPNGSTVTATATNSLGNTSSPASVTVDAVAPAAPVINPTNGTFITGTAEVGVTIILSAAGDPLGQTIADANGNWSFTPASPLANGTIITAVARDAAGNISPPGAVVVDALALPAPVIDPTDGTMISGTALPGLTITLSADGMIFATAVAYANGNWSFTPNTPLVAGTIISAVARDALGNQSPAAEITVISTTLRAAA